MKKPENIAVIGSGMAGLVALWSLRKAGHKVTLFERYASIGMAHHNVELQTSGHVDIPLRVSGAGGWPNLLKLCEELSVPMIEVPMDASYGRLLGPTQFAHGVPQIGSHIFPIIPKNGFWGARTIDILGGLFLLHRLGQVDKYLGRLKGKTLYTWLKQRPFSTKFTELWLQPVLALALTCSHKAIQSYPAETIVDFANALLGHTFRRFAGGTKDLAQRLAESANQTEFGQDVASISKLNDKIVLKSNNGQQQLFDRVVVGTQANHAADLLKDVDPGLSGLLSKIPYEKSHVVVHEDERLMPKQKSMWKALNFFASSDGQESMTTVWVNQIEPSIKNSSAMFQTINPITQVRDDKIHREVTFERPVVTLNSQQILTEIWEKQSSPDRKVWVCGSYADDGVPLLETAVTSALKVSRSINN